MLPKADLYICTGDMLVNFMLLKFRHWNRKLCQNREFEWDPNGPKVDPSLPPSPRPPGENISRQLVPERERYLQTLWMQNILGGYRQWFANPDAPVVCVRGNHDFVDLTPAFGGDVWEVDDDSSRTTTVCGLTVGGFRGVPPISGEWNDEKTEEELAVLVKSIPKVDILISHAPPYGVLDSEGAIQTTRSGKIASDHLRHFGSKSYMSMLNSHMYSEENYMKALCFGHVHESHGISDRAGIIVSNGATKFNVFDL